MHTPLPALLALSIGAALVPAHAQQFHALLPSSGSTSSVTVPTGGGFLGGADDCNASLTPLPPGTQLGLSFTTGTTGAEGQNEALCYAFGSSSIANDVWFSWTAATTGNVQVRTCGTTPINTRLAIWPGGAGCPADGTSLACNDDACGLQSTAVAAVTAGTSYRIQLGTFPGAAGGSGTFDVVESAALPCGQLDSGATTNALGLIAGGEVAWLHAMPEVVGLDGVSTAYGSLLLPGAIQNGNGAQIAAYSTADPTAAGAAAASLVTVTTNANTDLLNSNPFGVALSHPLGTTILATADQAPGLGPIPLDASSPAPEAWIAGSTLGPGTFDVDDINAANVAPAPLASVGFAGCYLLRADSAVCLPAEPGSALCFGDGSGTACPCANEDPSGGGCANSSGAGAALSGAGSASVTANAAGLNVLELTATGALPGQPGLFFQGDVATAGGAGLAFGDGLRCAGTNLVRLVTVVPDAAGCAASAGACGTVVGGTPGSIPDNPAQGPIPNNPPAAGDTRTYQYWYRDPAGGPCGSGFNLTNGYAVTWMP